MTPHLSAGGRARATQNGALHRVLRAAADPREVGPETRVHELPIGQSKNRRSIRPSIRHIPGQLFIEGRLTNVENSIPVEVHFTGMDADPSLSQRVVRRFRELVQDSEGLTDCSVSIEADTRHAGDPAYAVYARILTRHGSISACRDDRWRGEHSTPDEAIGATLDALERRLAMRRRAPVAARS